MNSILGFLKNKRIELVIGLFVFTLGFSPDWSSKGLILMIIVSIFCFKVKNLVFEKKYLLPLLIAIVYIAVNMLLLTKKIDFSNFTTVGLCILFFTLIFQMRDVFANLKMITIFFTSGLLTVGIVNLVVFFVKSDNYAIFDSWETYSIFDIHKIYFGAFINLSLLMLFYLNVKEQIKSKEVLFIIPLFVLLLLYTGSMSNLFIFVLISCLYLSYKYLFFLYKGVYLLLLGMPIVILILLSNTHGKSVFEQIDGEKSRIRNFEVNTSIIIEAPFFGHGIGEELLTMQKARSKKSWEYINEYNAHNQYFQYLIGGGIVYLIFSIFPIIYINIKDRKLHQNLFANGFTLILSYIFLIESFQERHHGQMFYTFFVSLIIYEMNKDKIS